MSTVRIRVLLMAGDLEAVILHVELPEEWDTLTREQRQEWLVDRTIHALHEQTTLWGCEIDDVDYRDGFSDRYIDDVPVHLVEHGLNALRDADNPTAPYDATIGDEITELTLAMTGW